MFNIFLQVMFVVDLLVVGCLSLVMFERRKLFWLRFPISVVICVCVAYFIPNLTSIWLEHNIWKTLIDNTLQVLLVGAVFAASWKLDFKKTVFILSFAYFIQRTQLCLDRIIVGTLEPKIFVIIHHYGCLILVLAVIYALYWRKIRTKSLDRMSTWQIISLVTLVLVADIFLNCFVELQDEENTSFRLADLIIQLVGLAFQYSILCFTALEDIKYRLDDLLKKSENQYHISRENIEMLNIKAHDLRYKIREFKDNGKIDDESLSEMNRTIDQYDSFIHVGKRSLDIILTEKSMICNQKGIEFTTLINGKKLDGMEGSDVYSLFGNALDNAIEATEKIENKEKRFISLSAKELPSTTIITVENSCSRIIEFKDGTPQTDKEDKNNHGFGTIAIKHIANKYGGEVSYSQKGKVFRLDIILPSPLKGAKKEEYQTRN